MKSKKASHLAPNRRDKPRIVGPWCGDPTSVGQCFMPAKSLRPLSVALAVAKSPCRGAARRCAAGFALDSARVSLAGVSTHPLPQTVIP